MENSMTTMKNPAIVIDPVPVTAPIIVPEGEARVVEKETYSPDEIRKAHRAYERKMAKCGALPGAKMWDAAKSGTFAYRTSEFVTMATVGKDMKLNRKDRRHQL